MITIDLKEVEPYCIVFNNFTLLHYFGKSTLNFIATNVDEKNYCMHPVAISDILRKDN